MPAVSKRDRICQCCYPGALPPNLILNRSDENLIRLARQYICATWWWDYDNYQQYPVYHPNVDYGLANTLSGISSSSQHVIAATGFPLGSPEMLGWNLTQIFNVCAGLIGVIMAPTNPDVAYLLFQRDDQVSYNQMLYDGLSITNLHCLTLKIAIKSRHVFINDQ